MMFGKSYYSVVKEPEIKGSFEEVLGERILDESGDFRKYGEQYIQTQRNDVLKMHIIEQEQMKTFMRYDCFIC